MKKYIGTKTIMAMPMVKSEAEQVLNRSLADATGGDDGYLIEYPDGSHICVKDMTKQLSKAQ